MRKFILATLSCAALLCGSAIAQAQTIPKVWNWTWTNTRTNGAALPLTAIGGFLLCDMSVPVPSGTCNGGTPVSCPVTFPSTSSAGTCTANVVPGHSFVAIELDNSVPPIAAAPSNTVVVPLPLAPPNPITDLR